LCLFIESAIQTIPLKSDCVVGIDPGYKSNLTLSSGEKIDKPKRLQRAEKRLAQAQRGKIKRLTARLQERIKNRRKDDNHKLYRKLGAEASRYQLRQMLSYKCTASGRKYIEVDSKGSTMTCSKCLAKTGPIGKAGLSVRQWECAECGILHDRDQNAAINTLLVGLGTSLERSA